MHSIPSLTAWGFAVAGLTAAAGPIVIHLLNRRRFRTVYWAAMEFLREALQRNRRILELRDVAILSLRTLAVLLFGLALAQPFVSRDSILMWVLVFPAIFLGVLLAIGAAALWSEKMIRWLSLAGSLVAFAFAVAAFVSQFGVEGGDRQSFDGSQPLHAVLVIDNSLSMNYDLIGSTLLDEAKQRAKSFVETLPVSSRVSVIPLCGSHVGHASDAYSKEESLAVIDQIEVVDRSASVQSAANAAKKACESGPDLARRIVFFSDQQAFNWAGLTDSERFGELPEMQFVDVCPVGASAVRENTWVADFRVENGLADVETPTVLIAEIGHSGEAPRKDLQVALTVDGHQISTKTVAVEPGLGAREVRFEHQFSGFPVEKGRPTYVAATVSITPDRLPDDDQRHLVVPVVAELPVVFIDQYSEVEENPDENRVGETKSLRKLLAPRISRNDATRHLIKIRHLSVDEIDRTVLEDARLVVIAGIAEPGTAVPMLRDYVKQGGRLFVAAGAAFDPLAWNEAAWLDGDGILPAPLRPQLLGELPEHVTGELKPYFLAYESFQSHHYFQFPETSENDLRSLYSVALIFRFADVNFSDEMQNALRKSQLARLTGDYEFLDRLAQGRELEARGELDTVGQQTLKQDEQRLPDMRPGWLLWKDDIERRMPAQLSPNAAERNRQLDEIVHSSGPWTLATLNNEQQSPYIVERRIGEGKVVFVSSGVLSSWSNIHTQPTFLLFDRILRSLIQETLPQRNFAATERITLPLPAGSPPVTLTLRRPGVDGQSEVLDAGFIGKDQRGFSIDNPLSRGVYRVIAYDAATPIGDKEAAPIWEMPLGINGSADESQLVALTESTFESRAGNADNVRWVAPGADISLAGPQIRNQNMWVLFIVAVLTFLLAELVLLAMPKSRRGGVPVETNT